MIFLYCWPYFCATCCFQLFIGGGNQIVEEEIDVNGSFVLTLDSAPDGLLKKCNDAINSDIGV